MDGGAFGTIVSWTAWPSGSVVSATLFDEPGTGLNSGTGKPCCLKRATSMASSGKKKLASLTKVMFDAFAQSRFEDCAKAVAELDAAFGKSKLTGRYNEEIEARRGKPLDPEFRGEIQLFAK